MTPNDSSVGSQNDRFFHSLFEQAADGMFVADRSGVCTHVNASGHRLLGYPEGGLTGLNIADLLRAEDHACLAATLADVRRGAVHTREWVMVRKDGSLIEAELTVQTVREGAILGILHEIGQRRHRERTTLASEARLRSILATAPDSILTLDLNGRILFLNHVRDPWTMEGVLGTRCFDYIPDAYKQRMAQALEFVRKTREVDSFEVPGPMRANGELRWSAVRVGPLIENDEVVAVTLCSTDITQRKREDAEHRELFERLQKIASQVPGLVYQYKQRSDGSACFTYVSERIRDIYRVSPEEVRHDASKVLALFHPDDYARVVEVTAESARTLQRCQLEYRVKFPNGDVRWLLGNALPDRQDDGSIVWHGFVMDVTDEKAAEAAHERLQGQLRQAQKVESIGRLAGGVAHDFNNLLTAILGFTELAMAEVPPSSETASLLEGIADAAHRGATLTQQLLAFARRKIVKPEVVDLNEIVSRLGPMLRRLVGTHLELVIHPAPGLGLAKVDVGSMEQVIMNLTVNARDAMSSGGLIRLETSNVQVDADQSTATPELAPGAYVVFTVSDTGPGLTPEAKARLFEPFFTTKPLGAGSGLGLAMCHGIAKQAGGTITVTSEPGAGATFRVFLPRVADAQPTRAAAKPQPLVGGHETLLVVEDEQSILRAARGALEAMGYRVFIAPDGRAALELVQRTPERIDLVVTDVIMPVMGGRELACQLQRLRPGIRVLYSSGYTEDAIVEEGVLAEGIEFLQKPYTPALLTKRVREVLDKR